MAFDPDIHPEYRRHDPYLAKDNQMDVTPLDIIQSALLDVQHHGDSIKEVVVLFRLDPYSSTEEAKKDLRLYKDNTTSFVDMLGIMAFCRMSMERDFQNDCINSENDEE